MALYVKKKFWRTPCIGAIIKTIIKTPGFNVKSLFLVGLFLDFLLPRCLYAV